MTTDTKIIQKTITTIFMLPTLKISREELTDNGFISAYSDDEMHDPKYDDSIYLLFKPSQLDRFREFLDSEYERTKQIIEDYDYPNGFVVVVYKLNSEFKHDFDLVRKGKYSKTSPSFQNEFPKVIKIMINGLHRDELSIQYRIFRRTQDLKDFWESKFSMKFDDDQEIWERFDKDKETLTQEKLKSYE